MQNRRSLKNGDARHSGTLFNTHSTDMWDDEKRPAVSLYLDELLIQKCQFRERFNASIFSLERLSPRGSCHLDESSMNHTLAQKYLIELLMWNASYVQKHLHLNLTGDIGWSGVKNCAKEIIQIVLMQLVHLLLTVEIQIAKTVQTKKIEHRLFETGKVVLGLAISHSKGMKQVRGVDQTPYQSWHSPLRWATSYAHEVAPLL